MTAQPDLTLDLPTSERTVGRPEVEDFLYREAHLLDTWQLDAWLALFVPGATMEVPTTDNRGWTPAEAGYFVCDDWDLLRARVKRLKSRKAHAENPRSRTHRMVGNVCVVAQEGAELTVGANVVVHRYRDGAAFTYVARYDHRLVVLPDGLRFVLRRAVPVNEAMGPGERLSFIL
ncbi:aromatic-ring-hydroxylating dioxygenase subunit beta [Pseudonocardia pini]|uniref:aromatic-ring-hydroxylating dioxygenase subunit beta n=1 Tax=Pseudonocardia pini TaxID=2758030 RepID=UPI0015F0E172|nr:aromatic-ring-hydroxylating dioxygenase subunit beta [Pseudonocardia pini]